jgi:transcription elongation factor Elf1
VFEDQKIGVACPVCSHKTEKTTAWLKTNDLLTCGSCGIDFVIYSEKLFSWLKRAQQLFYRVTFSLIAQK